MTVSKKMGLASPPATEFQTGGEIDLETRQRILEAAGELFISRGFKGVSMRDVAEAVKVTPAALYYHFPKGKEDLFVDFLKQMFNDYARGATEAVKPGRDTREKLRLLALHILSQLSHDTGWPTIMRDVHQYLDQAKQPEIWKHYGMTYIRAIRDIFQGGIDNNELNPNIPAEALTNMFYGMTFSFSWGLRKPECLHDSIEAGRIADMVITVLLDGAACKQDQIE